MAILTLWIRGRKIHFDDLNILMSGDFGDKAAKIEYLKEESQFWRMIHVGLAGGYFAIIISWGNFFMILNKTIVAGNEAEAFTLNNATFGLMGITTIALIVCPLSEAFKRHRETAQLFLQIQKEES
jgi:cellobiose-specific phosphotransferase system component IIC